MKQAIAPSTTAAVACLAGAVLLAACGDNAGATDVATGPVPAGFCGQLEVHPILPSPHQEEVADDAYNSNPPTSGPHSPAWAKWDLYYPELARKHWVHNLEHGGVALLYRCDGDCPVIMEALRSLANDVVDDPLCEAPVRHRILVVRDQELPADVVVAAAAWGVRYTATCLDPDALNAFIAEHYGHGSEALCADGGDFGGEPLFP